MSTNEEEQERSGTEKKTRVKWQTKGFNETRPYLAILEGLDPEYTFRRRFISRSWQKTGVTLKPASWPEEYEDDEYDEYEWTLTGAYFDGDLTSGTVLEAREFYRNSKAVVSRHYYIVRDGGLVEITRDAAKALVTNLQRRGAGEPSGFAGIQESS
jgi:hypothetical protein